MHCTSTSRLNGSKFILSVHIFILQIIMIEKFAFVFLFCLVFFFHFSAVCECLCHLILFALHNLYATVCCARNIGKEENANERER